MPSEFDYAGYWDRKLEYFKKTEDLSSTRPDVASGEVIGMLIDLLEIRPGQTLLDLGCGYGRLFAFFLDKGAAVHGVDVSPRMLAEAEKNWKGHPAVRLHRKNAEELADFADNMFDHIVCYGVFDALECQQEALAHMARMLRPGGRLLLAGKHKPYFADDEEAAVAEVKAAQAGHPNFFSNWPELSGWFAECGLTVLRPFFYLRRGDSANNVYVTEAPPVFYDWNLILEKARP